MVNTQIYVGGLPEVDVEELKDLFSLCGQIDNVNLQTFIQRGGASNGYQDEKITYALLSFVEGASIPKAQYFFNSVYKNRILSIRRPNKTKYGICVCHDGLSEADIRSLFEKIGPLELVQGGKNMVFINYNTEEHRQQAVDEQNFFFNNSRLPLIVTKKEFPSRIAPAVTYTGEEFSVYTTVKVGTTREELERMFTLCGALGTVFLEQGIGRITFLTQDGQRKALFFNRSVPDGWEEAIKISLEPPVESALSVFVTGINDDISEELLLEFFEDAGPCTVEVQGFDRAVVTFENEECRDKALAFNGTAVGMTPGRRLKIVKRYVF